MNQNYILHNKDIPSGFTCDGKLNMTVLEAFFRSTNIYALKN